jgi:glycosyltransferase involved in cell wall biosynthesis
MQRYSEILPPVFGEAILPWFDKASIYLLPARVNPKGGAETQAFSLQEAMSAGCLVISTNTGGIVEVTRNGELASLVEPNSPEQLAEAMIQMLAKREQWPEMRSNALQWVEQNYSLQVWSPKLADLYRETQVQWSASKGGLLRARK